MILVNISIPIPVNRTSEYGCVLKWPEYQAHKASPVTAHIGQRNIDSDTREISILHHVSMVVGLGLGQNTRYIYGTACQ
jgi:hypothetical protein